PQNPIALALLPCVRQFNLRREDFLAVIDGMEMDAVEDIVAPSMDKLDLYCDRVASAVGRLSVRAFGATEPQADDVAHHLGRALRSRNVSPARAGEAGAGGLYRRAELRDPAEMAGREPMKVVGHPRLREACQVLARHARQHFAGAHVAMASCAKGPMRPAAIM